MNGRITKLGENMTQNKVGVIVLPPLNPASKSLLMQYTENKHVLTNQPFGPSHTQLKIVDDMPSKIYSDNTVYIDKSTVTIPIHKTQSKYAAYMIEIAKRVDKLIIVAPGPKIPVIMALIASEIVTLKNIIIIVGDKLITPKDIMHEISVTPKDKLESQWMDIMNKNPNTAVTYKSEDLITTPSGATLRPYQQQMVDFVEKIKRAGLFVDMGLGKTLATLATINKLVTENKIDITKPILIVAPIMVALDTWSREAEKWGYDMDVKINIQLSPKKRDALLSSLLEPQEKLTLVTTNPAQLKGIISYFKSQHRRPPFQVAIVDELSQFKSPTAQRFEQLQLLTGNCEYFFGLTGTPAPNNLLDIWSQMIVIDKNNSHKIGSNFFQYRNEFFMPDKIGRDGTVYKWKLKPESAEKIYDLMRPTVISMRSEGLIDLPDIVYDNRYVKLPKKAMDLYHKMDVELRHELNDTGDSNEPITLELDSSEMIIPNSAVLTGKLAQLSSGALYDNVLDPLALNTGQYEVFHDVKMKALKDIVETATSPILVFFFFKSELERMKDYIEFEHLYPKRPDVNNLISRWNKGEVPVMVAHPASVGHGLNLQDGGHIMVWLTTTWSNEQYRQSVKRLYRSGQKETVSVIHIVAEHTVDEDIIDRIDTKEEGQDQLMQALDVADRG